MLTHLASLSERRLVVSFAPYTPYYAVLKRIGELFPGPSKARGGARRAHGCRRVAPARRAGPPAPPCRPAP